MIVDDFREIIHSKFWLPFKIVEFPFVLARQFTVAFLDEDIYCKEENIIAFILTPWIGAYAINCINKIIFSGMGLVYVNCV